MKYNGLDVTQGQFSADYIESEFIFLLLDWLPDQGKITPSALQFTHSWIGRKIESFLSHEKRKRNHPGLELG